MIPRTDPTAPANMSPEERLAEVAANRPALNPT
jgi:hypothetical protein